MDEDHRPAEESEVARPGESGLVVHLRRGGLQLGSVAKTAGGGGGMTAQRQRRPESPQRDLGWTSDLWPETSLPMF